MTDVLILISPQPQSLHLIGRGQSCYTFGKQQLGTLKRCSFDLLNL